MRYLGIFLIASAASSSVIWLGSLLGVQPTYAESAFSIAAFAAAQIAAFVIWPRRES